VHGLLPEGNRELDRFDRFLAVQHDRLAVGSDLLAAERPEVGIPPAGRVAEGVARSLPDRPALGLELLAGITKGVPGLGEGLVADVLEPGLAIGDQSAAARPRHTDPLVAARGGVLADVAVPAPGAAKLVLHSAHAAE